MVFSRTVRNARPKSLAVYPCISFPPEKSDSPIIYIGVDEICALHFLRSPRQMRILPTPDSSHPRLSPCLRVSALNSFPPASTKPHTRDAWRVSCKQDRKS